MPEETKSSRGADSDVHLTRKERAAAARQAQEAEIRKSLEQARERFLTAAIAFCDGSISPGQLRAVREILREQQAKLDQLMGTSPAPFPEEKAPTAPLAVHDVVETGPLPRPVSEQTAAPAPPGMAQSLAELDAKLARLEHDFQRGTVNTSQYRAIRKHYLEQRQVAIRLKETNPLSDRWKVVLQEGKTTFLLQLNEATCRSVAFYDLKKRDRIFIAGDMPPSAESAMSLLETFGQPKPGGDRMLATQTEDGSALLLIPGRFTAALVVFSQEPPGWQVRALREVHRNFEIANKAALDRGHRSSLVYPDLSRFIRP